MSISTSGLEVDLRPQKPPMLRVEADVHVPTWAAEHRSALRSAVNEYGSLQIRGLELGDVTDITAVTQQLAMTLMTDKESFATREAFPGGVYSSSSWPAKQQMCMHHEVSYRLEFPGLMLFACLVAPTDGGAIPIADSPSVLESLPPDLVKRFEQGGWMLTRNYTEEIGQSVGEAFGTEDHHAVEEYCRSNAIEFEWQPDGGLRTRQRRAAVLPHPISGQRCWFNQIAFLSEWTLHPDVREFLVDMYGADGLPFTTSFGNGDPIGEDIVELINEAYEANTAREELRAGDLMLVDNIRTAHSRDPFEGPREVVVAMGDPVQLANLSPTVEHTTAADQSPSRTH